jgi:hypothetical protein
LTHRLRHAVGLGRWADHIAFPAAHAVTGGGEGRGGDEQQGEPIDVRSEPMALPTAALGRGPRRLELPGDRDRQALPAAVQHGLQSDGAGNALQRLASRASQT